jgi:hypothetical protein
MIKPQWAFDSPIDGDNIKSIAFDGHGDIWIGASAMLQNYPNPFNPSTTVRFSVPRKLHVSLRILDMLGHDVATLMDGESDGGDHIIRWDASGFAGGIYVVQLQTGNHTNSRKCLLLK